MSVRVEKVSFGKLANGEEVQKYTLINKDGFEFSVISYGAAIQSIKLNDKNQKPINVALGFETLNEYLYHESSPYFGATVGPVCNRISNGKFSLNETEYELEKNNGKHCLHSGSKGFSFRNWLSLIIDNGVKFSLCSLDKEDGFPGEVWAEAIYTLSSDTNEINIEYKAVTDQDTPIDLTNHVYLNLNGHDSGVKVYNHKFKFNADKYLDFVPEEVTVTGKVNECKGTKYDFQTETKLNDRIKPEGKWPEEGYDNYFILNDDSETKSVATVRNDSNGVVMKVMTTQNGFQFYTGNFIDVKSSAIDHRYSIHDGFCVETHNYPDSVNKESFPTNILNSNEEYHHKTTFSFEIEN